MPEQQNATAMRAALEAWKALPEDERNCERPFIMGFNAGWEAAENAGEHEWWGAGEPNCSADIKAGNGELHSLRCKKCGSDDPATRCTTRPSDQALWEGFRSSVSEALEEGDGCWEPCTGCHETEDGQEVGNYTYNDVLRCRLGGGCPECGGIGAVWHDYRGIEEWAREVLSSPTEAQPDTGDALLREAVRSAIAQASGDDCNVAEAEFWLQSFKRSGLTVSLSGPAGVTA